MADRDGIVFVALMPVVITMCGTGHVGTSRLARDTEYQVASSIWSRCMQGGILKHSHTSVVDPFRTEPGSPDG